MSASEDSPVIIVGGGLAGLVAAFELSKRNVRSVIVDQESEANLESKPSAASKWLVAPLLAVAFPDRRRDETLLMNNFWLRFKKSS